MKKMKFTSAGIPMPIGIQQLRQWATVALLFVFTLFSAQEAQSCTITVPDQLNVSLNASCVAQVSASNLFTTQNCTGTYTVEIFLNGTLVETGTGSSVINIDGIDINGNPYNVVDQLFTFKVTNDATGNNQSGLLLVEDKLAPTISCQSLSVVCSDNLTQEIENHLMGFADDNCSNVTLNLVQTLPDLPGDCEAGIVRVVRRVYQAVDQSGNASPICTLEVVVNRPDLDEVDFPADQTISCSASFAADSNGNPLPSFSGAPTLGGNNLFPFYSLCNVTATYTDMVIPGCGTSRVIRRMWSVTEICGGFTATTGALQTITIAADQDPFFTGCPTAPIQLNTNNFNCQATFAARSLGIQATNQSGCSEVIQLTVRVIGGQIISNLLDPTQSDLLTLHGGQNIVQYIAYDACLNTDTCEVVINVDDHVAPVAVCKEFTTVTLNNLGQASVFASSLDNGSWDNCGIFKIEARRMDPSACDPNPVFDIKMDFCCSDAGQQIPVILRVTDTNNNFNECMVFVTVQDKTAPIIVAPSNITVDCNTFYDLNDLSLFGKVVLNDESLRENIVVGGQILGIDGIAVDICGANITESIFSNTIDQCGVGQIIRRFEARDPDDNIAVAFQTVTFEITNPFTESDITWPAAMVNFESCGADVDPDLTGRPILNTAGKCALVGTSHKDIVFQFVDDACFKVIRTWTVMDWCQKENNQYKMWQFHQTIKVIDVNAPVFDPVADISVCSFNAECEQEMVDLTANATDICTPDNELVYTWFVNANYNPSQTNPAVFRSGTGKDASGIYPIGTHRVVFSAKDKCGNTTFTNYLFTVANCKKPSPICRNLVAELSEMTDSNGNIIGMATVTADMFNAASFSTCGGDLIYSFSSDPTNNTLSVTCEDVGVLSLQIWVTDIFGNQDFCTVTLQVQDNMEVCDGILSGFIAGLIKSEGDEPMEAVTVNVSSSNDTGYTSTSNEGTYTMRDLNAGVTYSVAPVKDNDILNGITVLDLVLIQRHMLGANLLTDPYKMLAADINNDRRINAEDILLLRQVILNRKAEFDNNTSWRFIDANYEFQDASNPFLEDQLPTSVQINDAQMGVRDVNFVAIKVGDVNNSAVTRNLNGTEDRSRNTANFWIEDSKFKAGQVVEVPVRLSDLASLTAFQFTMKYNAEVLTLVGTEPGIIELTNHQIAVLDADQGIVTAGWGQIESILVQEEDVLFTLLFSADREGSLAQVLALNSQATPALLYDGSETEYNLGVEFRATTAIAGGMELRQNVPNPFTQETMISFVLPEALQGTFNVYDLSGKVVYSRTNVFNAGENQLVLRKTDLGSTGVYYYELRTNKGSITKKMVLVN
jgi:hypothetical protein